MDRYKLHFLSIDTMGRIYNIFLNDFPTLFAK